MSSYYRDVTDGSQDGKNILKESGGIDYSTYLGVSVSKQLYGTVWTEIRTFLETPNFKHF